LKNANTQAGARLILTTPRHPEAKLKDLAIAITDKTVALGLLDKRFFGFVLE
jgi:hypothetical protein